MQQNIAATLDTGCADTAVSTCVRRRILGLHEKYAFLARLELSTCRHQCEIACTYLPDTMASTLDGLVGCREGPEDSVYHLS